MFDFLAGGIKGISHSLWTPVDQICGGILGGIPFSFGPILGFLRRCIVRNLLVG